MHCGIAFRRDFTNRVVRAGPETSYDALVQFGNAPITNIVNLQWKCAAMEKYNAERAKSSALRGKQLLSDYTEKRQKGHESNNNKVSVKVQRKSTKGSVKWERPVCMKNKKRKSGTAHEQKGHE